MSCYFKGNDDNNNDISIFVLLCQNKTNTMIPDGIYILEFSVAIETSIII